MQQHFLISTKLDVITISFYFLKTDNKCRNHDIKKTIFKIDFNYYTFFQRFLVRKMFLLSLLT